MRRVNFGMEEVGQSYWIYKQRSAGDPGRGPLYPVLKWIVEQLNLGNFAMDVDDVNEVVGITLGRDAIPTFSSKDAALEHARSRFMIVSLAGAFAKAREEGAAASESPKRQAFDHGSGRIRRQIARARQTGAYFPGRFFGYSPTPVRKVGGRGGEMKEAERRDCRGGIFNWSRWRRPPASPG